MRVSRVALLSTVTLLLGACAGPVILGLNIGTISTIGSVASTAATGKGLGEHAVSAIADKDCRFIEPVFRKDRQFCEENDSPARKEDFNGLASLFEGDKDAPSTMVAAAPQTSEGDIAATAPTSEGRAVETASLETASLEGGNPETVAAQDGAFEPVSPDPAALAPSAGRTPAVAVVPVGLPKPAAPLQLAAAPPLPQPKPGAVRVAAPPLPGPYAVRVGSYANAGLADAFARKLRDGGYEARVVRMRGEGQRTFSVVHILGFRDAAAAERAAKAIARDHDTAPGFVFTRA